jgi:hypothetical protein
MANESPFHAEWRRCLREQYKEVIRSHDTVTERTLVKVLYRVGFTDDELRQLYLEATMRAEGLADGMQPDMSKLPLTMHPAECTCDACQMDIMLDAGHDDEGQPLAPEIVAEPDPEPMGNIFPVAKMEEQPEPEDIEEDAPPKISPKQLSMF